MLKVFPWQESQWREIMSRLQQDRLPHALLLTGPAGIGLTHFSNCLSAKLLCQRTVANDFACGECGPCILFQAGTQPDHIRVEAEEKGKQIKIDQIRSLIGTLYLSSQAGGYKIAVIDPADSINRNAANSLLKTLEEPPADSLIILISHQPSSLLVTVRSRCQRLNFPPSNDALTLNWLEQTTQTEPAHLHELLVIAQGAPLKAIALLDTDTLAHQQTLLQDLIELSKNKLDPIKLAEKWQGFGTVEVFQYLLIVFFNMAKLKLTGTGKITNNPEITVYLQELVNRLDLAQLFACYDQTLKNYQAVTGPFNLNKQGLLEDIIIYWQSILYK